MHELITSSLKKTFYVGSTSIPLFQSISHTFIQGQTYIVTGPSGAGKSTLLNLLAGLDQPTYGSIFFDNQDLTTLSPSQKKFLLLTKFGLVFQYAHLIKELTVLENVMIKSFFTGQDTDSFEPRAQELLIDMGLKSKIQSYPTLLSAGEQQRVALARALLTTPAFLIADEPTGNLDQKTGYAILDLLLNYQKTYTIGLILSSHDKNIIQRFTYHLILENGCLRREE